LAIEGPGVAEVGIAGTLGCELSSGLIAIDDSIGACLGYGVGVDGDYNFILGVGAACLPCYGIAEAVGAGGEPG
jgi:hypothetical protein